MKHIKTLQEGLDFLDWKFEKCRESKQRAGLPEKELKEGLKAEKEFLKYVWPLSKKRNIYISDLDEDESEHWDIAIGKMLYDVKSNCSIPFGRKTMWVELITRMGKKGSLYGIAHYLVFRYSDPYHFLVCKRQEVYELLRDNNGLRTNKTEDHSIYEPYGRPQYKEVIVRVPIKDLANLNGSREIEL